MPIVGGLIYGSSNKRNISLHFKTCNLLNFKSHSRKGQWKKKSKKRYVHNLNPVCFFIKLKKTKLWSQKHILTFPSRNYWPNKPSFFQRCWHYSAGLQDLMLISFQSVLWEKTCCYIYQRLQSFYYSH